MTDDINQQQPKSTFVWPSDYYPMHPGNPSLNQLAAENHARQKEEDARFREFLRRHPTTWKQNAAGMVLILVVALIMLACGVR